MKDISVDFYLKPEDGDHERQEGNGAPVGVQRNRGRVPSIHCLNISCHFSISSIPTINISFLALNIAKCLPGLSWRLVPMCSTHSTGRARGRRREQEYTSDDRKQWGFPQQGGSSLPQGCSFCLRVFQSLVLFCNCKNIILLMFKMLWLMFWVTIYDTSDTIKSCTFILGWALEGHVFGKSKMSL